MPAPHRTSRQIGTALLLSAALSLGLSACKSSPAAGDQAAQNQPITLSGPEDLLQTSDTLLALRVNFGGELPAVIRNIGATEEYQTMANMLEDPVVFLQNEPEAQIDLSALNTERPLYVTLSSIGNEDFLKAAAMGLPTRDEEWPSFALYRALLPTDDPSLMATQFDQLVDRFNSENPRAPMATRSFEGPGFLRVEFAALMNASRLPDGERLELAQAWLDALALEKLTPPSAAAFRPTAAYNAFVEAESEIALWTRFDALAHLGILEASMSPDANLRHSGGEAGLARFRLENISRLATASVVNDPVAAENEDISVHIDATDAGAVLIDAVLTHTSQGARVHEASASSMTLPAINAEHFLALDWSLDVAALASTVIAPFWELDYQGGTSSGFEDLGGNDLRARITRSELAVPLLSAAGQYPMALVNSLWQTLGQSFPLPRAATLRAFSLPQGGQLPVGMAAALVFDNEPGVRDQLQQLLTMGQMAIPVSFDAALIERDDSLIELRVTLGSTVASIFEGAGEITVRSSDFELDMTRLGQLRAMLPPQAGLAGFDRITFATAEEEGYQSVRFGLNVSGEAKSPTFANDAPLLTAPTFRCRTELAASAFTHLEYLGGEASAKADRYLSTFSERADRCIEPTHPYAAQAKARLEMAREWAAQLDENAPQVESVY